MEYTDEIKRKYFVRLKELECDLPAFTEEFFRAISDTTQIKTRVSYAYDLRVFFAFLIKEHDCFCGRTMDQIEIADLEKISPEDLEIYLEYLTFYMTQDLVGNDIQRTNKEKGKSRKLAAVRKMYTHFYKRKKIAANPTTLVETPKTHDKKITRLEIEEVARLLDEVERGAHLTTNEKKWHAKTKSRDFALISLLLGTGMRLSECIGIDIHHIDFNVDGVKVTRKGGNEATLYFGHEVRDALTAYLVDRQKATPLPGHEAALFLSTQNKRINERSVEKLVKKYSTLVVSFKNISPHKLRSTYGTNLYRESGDIYLVADALGHKDVNTTKKHYAAIDEQRRKSAAKFITLRES